MLTSTAKVALGMIALGRRTGYEIKQLVDVSTRFFWSASYGQLYPELRRLEQAGLVTGGDASANGRQRRAYELTDAGHAALDEWLRAGDELAYEMRDEGMLKLFFSDRLEPAERLQLVATLRARHEATFERLRAIEPRASRRGGGPYATLRFGLAYHDFCAGWLAGLERELETQLAERR